MRAVLLLLLLAGCAAPAIEADRCEDVNYSLQADVEQHGLNPYLTPRNRP